MALAGTRSLGRIRPLMVLLLVSLVVGCGGGQGGGTLPPTRTATPQPPSPSASATPSSSPSNRPTDRPTDRPTAERPTKTESIRPSPTPSPTKPTKPPTTKPTTTKPPTSKPPTTKPPTTPPPTTPPPTTPPPTTPPAPTSATPTPVPSVTSTTSTSTATSTATSPSSGPPAWVWWLLAALLIATAVAIPLIVRARRHAAWRRELVDAEAEIAWLARELLPQLRHEGSLPGIAGGWSVGEPRVIAVEDHLAVLESTGPDQPDRGRAGELLDAARRARTGMQSLTAASPDEPWVLDLDAIIDDLEHTLARHAPTDEV